MFTCVVAQGKGIFTKHYSPLAEEYGVIWGPTLHDERMTSIETLEKAAERMVKDSLPDHLKEG